MRNILFGIVAFLVFTATAEITAQTSIESKESESNSAPKRIPNWIRQTSNIDMVKTMDNKSPNKVNASRSFFGKPQSQDETIDLIIEDGMCSRFDGWDIHPAGRLSSQQNSINLSPTESEKYLLKYMFVDPNSIIKDEISFSSNYPIKIVVYEYDDFNKLVRTQKFDGLEPGLNQKSIITFSTGANTAAAMIKLILESSDSFTLLYRGY